ncbi:hypothetical protein CLAIMM_09079, partial [Cladophialophora immunda]
PGSWPRALWESWERSHTDPKGQLTCIWDAFIHSQPWVSVSRTTSSSWVDDGAVSIVIHALQGTNRAHSGAALKAITIARRMREASDQTSDTNNSYRCPSRGYAAVAT